VHFTPGIFRLRRRIVWGIISIGASPSLVSAASCVINVIINTSLQQYGGDSAVAAAGIFTTYTSLITSVVLGICQGMQPIVGYNYGAQRYDRLKKTFWLTSLAATILCTIGCVFGLSFPHLIARAFTVDAALIAETNRSLSLSLLMFWVVGFQIVSTNFFQSIGKAGRAIFLSLARQVIFMIPLLLVFPRMFGLDGVWVSFPLSDTFATVATIFMIVWQFRHLTPKS
jgi:Na+-driven multidrug efflux pump